MKRLCYILISLMLFAGIWVFCWQGFPELMSYQEQNQLFLSSADYLWANLCELGGLADYISEFVVQYGTISWLGSLLIAAVLTLLQILLGACMLYSSRLGRLSVAVYALSAVPSLLILRAFGDENLLMSYPVAIVITLAAALLTLRISALNSRVLAPIYAIGTLTTFWLAGGVGVLYAVIVPVLCRDMSRRWLWVASGVVLWLVGAWVLSRTLYDQYPESRLLLGLNYYRIPSVFPAVVYVAPAVIVGVALCSRIPLASWNCAKRGQSIMVSCIVVAIVAVGGALWVDSGYDREKMDLLRYDYLVRGERWYDIIAMAEAKPPVNDFALQAVNLALAKTGQLGERMFGFTQRGVGSLLEPARRDNTSCLITAEAFWHLGMINSAFRYAFDTQESIMNDRKSGRLLKRMAECMIVNGKYKIASKYLALLQKSPVYRTWASETAALLADTALVGTHPVYADKRRVRYADEMLYNYNEIDKMLGILALKSDGHNVLAWDYFNAAMLLNGDLQTFTGMYHYANEMFGITHIPRHHQEAIAMYWTFGHQTFDGIPFTISDEVKQFTMRLASSVMQNPRNPELWRRQFGDCYSVYLLKHLMAAQADKSQSPKGSERGD